MPYCTQCGTPARDVDAYCAKCGAKQPGAAQPPPSPPAADILSGTNARTASVCCYLPVIGWIPCIIVLASAKFRDDKEVRFHAFQGLYLFVVWLILDWVVGPMMGMVPGPEIPIGKVLKLTVMCAWVFMLIKISQGQSFRLPVIGELAERSVAEQKS